MHRRDYEQIFFVGCLDRTKLNFKSPLHLGARDMGAEDDDSVDLQASTRDAENATPRKRPSKIKLLQLLSIW